MMMDDSKSLKWQSAKTLIEKTLSPQDSVRAQTVLRQVFEHTREFGFGCTSSPDDAYFELRFSIRDHMKLREMTIMLHRMGVMPVTVCIPRETPEMIIMSLPIAKSPPDPSAPSSANALAVSGSAVAVAAPAGSSTAAPAAGASGTAAAAQDEFPNKPNDVSDQLYVSERDRANIRTVQKHLINIDFNQPLINFGFSDFPDHYKIHANNLCFVKLEKLYRLLMEVPEITDVDFFCASGSYPAGVILSLRYAEGTRKRSAYNDDEPDDRADGAGGGAESGGGGLRKRIRGILSFMPFGSDEKRKK